MRVAGANSPNSVSVFLQVPMYVTITAGEVLFSITGLEFAYSQVIKVINSYQWLLIFINNRLICTALCLFMCYLYM